MEVFRRLFFTCLVLLVATATASAYQYVGGGQNCQQCHTDYTTGSDWHNMHTNLAKDDCTKCHDEQQKVPTANCKTCHTGLPCRWVNDHTERGTETCAACHTTCTTDETTCPARSYLGQDDPRVETLRQFRDKVLVKSATGRALISAYYGSAAAVEEYLEAHPRLKASATEVLKLIAELVEPFVAR